MHLVAALLVVGTLVACSPSVERESETTAPVGIVLMIGDGMGFPQITFARRLLLEEGERWSLERLPVTGVVSTYSASNATTDSGAAATAMAAGVKTSNRALGVTSEGESVESFSEAALRDGWRVGYVTTTAMTHATPGAFFSHVVDRYEGESEIAVQLLGHRADLALGGGRGEFLPEAAGGDRTDGRDLLEEARGLGWTVWTEAASLNGELPERVLGLFSQRHFPFRLDEAHLPEELLVPSLESLTEAALAALGGSGDSFFLLIEGGRIDQACHSYDGPGAAWELRDFDRAVAAVERFRQTHADTLVLVTADHATGGLAINDYVDWQALERQRASVEWMADELRAGNADASMVHEMTGYEDIVDADLESVLSEPDKYEARRNLGRVLSERNGVTWMPFVGEDTRGHTGEDVPLYAAGPGAERFQGVLDNADIGRLMFEIAGFDSIAPSQD